MKNFHPASSFTEFDTIRSFWIGDTLPPFFSLCIRSWLALDYKVELYSYTDVSGVPDGCELKDAETVLSRATLLDAAPSIPTRFATHSDIFRMALLAQGLGPWCDTDYLMLRRLPSARDILIAREKNGLLCNAILWARPDFEMMERVLKVYQKGELSAWGISAVYMRWLGAKLSGAPFEHRHYTNNHWGRDASEFFIRKYKLKNQVLPYKSFYSPNVYNDSLFKIETPFEKLLSDTGVYGLHFFFKDPKSFEQAEQGSLIDWAKDKFS